VHGVVGEQVQTKAVGKAVAQFQNVA